MVIPKADAVLPAVEVAIELLKRASGNKKQRKPDLAAHELIAAVRAAYSDLTGNRGGRAILPGGQVGREHRLGKGIDRIFGTSVYPKIDSSRLRTPSVVRSSK